MYAAKENVLIKSLEQPGGYWIVHKESRGYLLCDDDKKAQEIIDNLLKQGVEIFEDEHGFLKKYPPLSFEERKKMGEEFLLRSSDKD